MALFKMKIVITYENNDFKATIPFQKLVELFELTDDQIESVKQMALEAVRTA